MSWPPRASIERTDCILVFMGPASLTACRQQMFDFTPTALMVGLGEKLGTDPWISQPTCCGLCQEPFSHEQWHCSTLLTTMWKVDICGAREIRLVESHTWTKRENVWLVGRIFPYRVYIDSNRHDSRIWVTGCLCQLERSNLMNLTCLI
jgi:hypothetical protein